MTTAQSTKEGPAAESPQSVIDNGMHRFLADGVHYRDLMDIKGRLCNWNDWPTLWSSFAEAAEARGDSALNKQNRATAAEEFYRASLYHHYAQYLFFDDPVLKERIDNRKIEVFARAVPLFDPPVEIVQIPFAGTDLKGYFRLPKGMKKPPCAILIGGLDTTKVDYRTVSDICVQRGLATLAFDGPGQGETVFKLKLTSDFESSISAAIDYLEKRPEIDADRVGVVGRSMGGYFAP